MQRILKIVFVLLFVVFAFAVVPVPVSAALEDGPVVDFYSMPDVHDYPVTIEGYTAYVHDWLEALGMNSGVAVVDAIAAFPDEVASWFGQDEELREQIDSFPDPREIFSQYYMNGGSTEGTYGGGGSIWTDGHGGKFYVENLSGESRVMYVSGYGESQVVYKLGGSGAGTLQLRGVSRTDKANVVIVHIYSKSVGGEKDIEFTLPYEYNGEEQKDKGHVRGKAGGLGLTLKTLPDGTVVAVDDDGNEYRFNPDGTLTINGDNWYFEPDLTTLTDDGLNDLNDFAKNWAMLMLMTMNNIDNDGGGCNCKDYSSILQYIASQCYNINQNLLKIKTSIDNFVDSFTADSDDEDAENEDDEDGESGFWGNILGGILAALGGIIGSLLTLILGDIEDAATKASYYSLISGIMLALNNLLPMVAISDVMTTLNHYIFEGGSPSAVTVVAFGKSVTVLDPSILDTFGSYISVVKSVISVIVLYKWLMAMRKKVSSS